MPDDADEPHGFMIALLRLCPHGLPPVLLQNIMAAQDINREEAASVIRRALETGDIELGQSMYLQAATKENTNA